MLVGSAAEQVQRFRKWAEIAGATVETVADEAGARAAVQRLIDETKATRIIATRSGSAFTPRSATVGESAREVADADLGVSTGRLGVAETGSVLMGSNVQEDRLVGMLSRVHVVILQANTIVASLNDAGSELRRLTSPGPEQLRYVGFVSGPSRTADIERVLTIGVQGPNALHIVLVEGG